MTDRIEEDEAEANAEANAFLILTLMHARDFWMAQTQRAVGERDSLRATLAATRAELDRSLTLAAEERRS